MINNLLKRFWRLTALLLLLCFVVSPSKPSAVVAKDAAAGQVGKSAIKVGYLMSLTGPGGTVGQDNYNGLKLYLDQIHNQIDGHPIELIVEDDQSQPNVAALKLRKLVEKDHVQLLDGILLSNIGYAVLPLINQLKTPIIFSGVWADDLTKRRRSPWAIRVQVAASQPMHPFGEWVRKNLKYKKAVVFGLDYPLGWESAGAFQKTFEANGGEVVQKIWVGMFLTDFKKDLERIDKSADCVFFSAANAPCETIAKQYKELGLKLPIIGAGGMFVESILSRVGEQLHGGYSALQYSAALDTPENKSFVSAYRAKYGNDPSFFSEAGYVSGMCIQKAADSLKGDFDDREKVLAALKHVELKSAPRGPIKFDDYGQPTDNIYITKVEKKGDHYQNSIVYTYKNVSQFWKWKSNEFLEEAAYDATHPPCTHCPSGK